MKVDYSDASYRPNQFVRFTNNPETSLALAGPSAPFAPKRLLRSAYPTVRKFVVIIPDYIYAAALLLRMRFEPLDCDFGKIS